MTPVRSSPFVIAVLLGLLAGCTANGYSTRSDENGSAEAAMARGDYLYAARAYQEEAQQQQPAQATELRLRAAEAAAAGNDFSLAGNLLAQLPPGTLNPDQQLRGSVVQARAALARNDPAGALRLLPVDPGALPSADSALLLRGRALFRAGDTVGATQTLVNRERLLRDPRALSDNRDAIWAGLAAAPLDAATLARASNADSVSRGWIELANLVRRNSPVSFYNGWRQRYPNHPGDPRAVALLAPGAAGNGLPAPAAEPPPQYVGPASAPTPTSTVLAGNGYTALLLPQSGPLAAVGNAVRSGYEAAAARAGNSRLAQALDITGGAAQVADAERRAASSGAGLIVGPLLKEDVFVASQLGAQPVPVLALNYLDTNHPAPGGFYQFGLAPEDEARAAAEDAFNRGLRRALVLVQAGEWGARVSAAFQQRLGELGGRTVDADSYGGEQETWADPIKRLLRFRPVEDRKAAAELRAKAAPGIDPQRRNDFDFIFLGARSQDQARLLWPLLRFYHAERIPIYATAAVNTGVGDNDLAGIRFCDAPWVLDNTGTWAAFRNDAVAGRNGDGARLYAMGADSYALAQRLTQGGLRAGDTIAGATGVLRVGSDGAIHRGLVCAQMNVGAPILLGAAGLGGAGDLPVLPPADTSP